MIKASVSTAVPVDCCPLSAQLHRAPMREPKLTTSSIPIPWGRKSTPGVRARESLESEQEQRRAALERMAQPPGVHMQRGWKCAGSKV